MAAWSFSDEVALFSMSVRPIIYLMVQGRLRFAGIQLIGKPAILRRHTKGEYHA